MIERVWLQALGNSASVKIVKIKFYFLHIRFYSMFFFSWFSSKSRPTKHASVQRDIQPLAQTPRRNAVEESHEGHGQTKNHASRVQLYEAIREAMTRFGILSASYKFKVLDLDQRNSNYLVMLDLTSIAGDTVPQPSEMEALIIQNAMLRYKIMVSAVYWRLNEVAAVSKPSLPSAVAKFPVPVQAVKKDEISHEPIHADEVAAFQRALLAASAHSPPVACAVNIKPKPGLRHSAHPKDFADTEVFEAVNYPVLSNTQYGDLH